MDITALDEYESNYPRDNFREWFLQWGKTKLEVFINLPSKGVQTKIIGDDKGKYVDARLSQTENGISHNKSDEKMENMFFSSPTDRIGDSYVNDFATNKVEDNSSMDEMSRVQRQNLSESSESGTFSLSQTYNFSDHFTDAIWRFFTPPICSGIDSNGKRHRFSTETVSIVEE